MTKRFKKLLRVWLAVLDRKLQPEQKEMEQLFHIAITAEELLVLGEHITRADPAGGIARFSKSPLLERIATQCDMLCPQAVLIASKRNPSWLPFVEKFKEMGKL